MGVNISFSKQFITSLSSKLKKKKKNNERERAREKITQLKMKASLKGNSSRVLGFYFWPPCVKFTIITT